MMKFIGETMDYTGIRKRSGVIKRMCSKGVQLADSDIEPFLEGTGYSVKYSRKNRKREDVQRKKEEARSYFTENCEGLVNAFYNKKYEESLGMSSLISFYKSAPNYFSTGKDTKIDKESKQFFNFIIYLSTNTMSWSQWLVLTPQGRDMVTSLFYRKSRFMALVNLFCLLNTVFISSGYDDVFFRKEFFAFLPSIEFLFVGTPLEVWLKKFVSATVTSTAIRKFLESK